MTLRTTSSLKDTRITYKKFATLLEKSTYGLETHDFAKIIIIIITAW
jgi:hypothetical protein